MARYKPGTGPYSKESSLDEDDLKWFFSGKDEGYLQGLEAYHEALLSFVQESYDFCTELGPCLALRSSPIMPKPRPPEVNPLISLEFSVRR